VCESIREQFSESGASVVSTGIGTVLVELPADCPDITQLVSYLWNEYDATCDLSTVNRTPTLTVWIPRRISTPAEVKPRVFNVCILSAFGILFFLGGFLLFSGFSV